MANWIFIILMIPFVITIFLFFLIISCPIYLIRILVNTLSWIEPGFAKMVHPVSSIYLSDNIFEKPRFNIVIAIVLDTNHVSVENVMQVLERAIIDIGDTSGSLLYPELRQKLTKWLGYYFWEWEEEFDLRDHIKLYEAQAKNAQLVINKDKFRDIVKKEIFSPLRRDLSPWEVKVLWNFRAEEGRSEKTVVLFKVHHVLADSYTILRLLINTSERNDIKSVARPLRERILRNFYRLIWAPYELTELAFFSRDVYLWRKSENSRHCKFSSALSSGIPIACIKTIRRKFGVRFSSVVYAALAGALRRLLIEKKVEIPTIMRCVTELPSGKGPIKLRNRMRIGFLKLPVGEPDPISRLKACDKYHKNLMASSVPSITFLFFFMVGIMPHLFSKLFFFNKRATGSFENIHGPPNACWFGNWRSHSLYGSAGPGIGHTAFQVMSVSYSNQLQIFVAFSPSILDEDADVDQFQEHFYNELKTLLTTRN